MGRRSAPKTRPRWWRILRRTIVSLLWLVIAVVLAAVAVLHLGWGRNALTDEILARYSDGIRGRIAIEDVQGSLLGEAALEGVRIVGPEGSTFLRLERVEIDWAPLSLLRTTVHLDRLALQGGRVLLGTTGAEGLGKALAPLEPPPEQLPGEPSAWRVVVEALEVERLDVLEHDGDGARGALGLSVRASVETGPEGAWWQVEKIAAELQGVPVEDVHVVTSGAMVGPGVRIDALAVDAGPHRLRTQGTVAFEQEGTRLDVLLNELHVVPGALGVATPPGPVRVEGTVAGPMTGLSTDLRIDTGAGRIDLRASADLTAGPRWRAELDVEGLAPERLHEAAAGMPTANLSLRAAGRGDPMSDGHARATLHVLELEGRPEVPLPIRVRARMIEGAPRVRLDLADEAGSLDLRAHAPGLPPGPLRARLRVRRLDGEHWAKLLGHPEFGGFVERLELDARAEIGGAGLEGLQGRLELAGRELRAPGASASRLEVNASAGWAGGAPGGDLALDVRGVKGGGASLERLRLTLRLLEGWTAEGPLRLDELRAPGDVALERLRLDTRLAVPGGELQRSRAEAGVDASGLDVGERLRAAGISGRLEAALEGPSAEVDLRLHDPVLAGRPLDRARTSLTVRPGGPSRAAVEVSGSGLRAAVTVAHPEPLRLEGPFDLRLEALELSRDERGFRAEPGARIRLEPANGRLEVSKLAVRGLGEMPGTLRLEGRASASALQAEIHARELSLAGWLAGLEGLGIPLPVEGLAGELDLDARVAGPPSALEGSLSLALRDGGVGSIEGLTVGLDAGVEASGTRVALDVAHREGRVTLRAETPWRPGSSVPGLDTELSAEATLEDVDLATIAPWLPQEEPRGRLGGELELEGSLRDPTGRLELSGRGLSFGPVREGTLDLLARIGPDEAMLEAMLARSEAEPMRVHLTLPRGLDLLRTVLEGSSRLRERVLEEPIALTLRLPDVKAAELPLARLGLPHDAEFDADLKLEGPIGDIEANGYVRAEKIPLGLVRGNVALRLRTTEQRLRGEIELTDQRGELLSGHLSLPRRIGHLLVEGGPEAVLRDERLTLMVLARLGIDRLEGLVPGIRSTLAPLVHDGRATVSATFRGGDDGGLLAVRAGISSLDVERPVEEEGVARLVQLSARVDGEGTRLTGVLDEPGQAGAISLEGTVGLTLDDLLAARIDPEAPLDLTLASHDVSLEAFARSFPALLGRSEGVLDIELHVGGTLERPRPEGHLAARFERLHLAAAGLKHEDVALVVRMTPERIWLEPLRLEDGDGHLELSLEVGLGEMKPKSMPVEGRLALDGFRLMRRNDARVRASGELTFAGTVARPGVDGDLVVDRATYVPALGGRSVQRIGAPADVVFVDEEASDTTPQRAGLMGAEMPLDLDVRVRIPPRRLQVRTEHGEQLDSFLQADLRAYTRRGELAMEGKVTILSGHVELYGRRFQLAAESQVIFDGSTPIDPVLNVKAHYGIADVDLGALGLQATRESRITVHVTGPAREPRLELTSDPPMDETNILSIIAMGHPVGGGGGGEEASMQKRMTNLFVGLAMGPTARFLREKLPIDVFRVESGDEGLSGTKFVVGKRITRDLVLLFESNLGAREHENINSLRVEYALTRRLNLETFYGDAGAGGIDLLFRIPFGPKPD